MLHKLRVFPNNLRKDDLVETKLSDRKEIRLYLFRIMFKTMDMKSEYCSSPFPGKSQSVRGYLYYQLCELYLATARKKGG